MSEDLCKICNEPFDELDPEGAGINEGTLARGKRVGVTITVLLKDGEIPYGDHHAKVEYHLVVCESCAEELIDKHTFNAKALFEDGTLASP